VSAVCNAVFGLTISCCVPEIFGIKSLSCPKSRRNAVLGRQISGGRGSPKFLTEFYKFTIWVTIEHVAKFADDRPSDVGDQATKKERKKKENLSDIGNRMDGGQL